MTQPEIALAALAVAIISNLMSAAAWIYVRITLRNQATSERLETIAEELHAQIAGHSDRLARVEATADAFDAGACPKHGERLAKLESMVAAAPSHDDLGEIHDKVNGIADAVSSLRGEFSGVKGLLSVIHQHLMDRSK